MSVSIVQPSSHFDGAELESYKTEYTTLSQPKEPKVEVAEVSKVEELPTDLPVAQLEIIHFNRLQAGDEAESAKLFKACTGQGFFYLDLQDVEPAVLEAIEQIYQLDEDLYNLPDEEKLRFDVDKLSPLKLNG